MSNTFDIDLQVLSGIAGRSGWPNAMRGSVDGILYRVQVKPKTSNEKY